MPHHKRSWILIADAAEARILVQEGAGEPLKLLDGAQFHNPDQSHHTHDLGTDHLPRTIESSGGARHAIEPKTDPRRHAAGGFAKTLAEFVERRAVEKSYDRLIVVAPPHMLSDLRKSMGKHAHALLAGELHKDLMKTPLHDLPSHLEPLIRF
jgi:protein required for attachment to host cells